MEIRIFVIHGTARPQYFTQRQRNNYQNKWLDTLIAYLEKRIHSKNKKFLWSGSVFTPWNKSVIEQCSQDMLVFFKLDKGASINNITRIIIAKSNGAQLAENALELLSENGYFLNLDIEIRLASPLRGSKNHAQRFKKRFLLVSNRDLLYKTGRTIMLPFFSRYDFKDPNQKVITFPLLRHNQFNHNNQVLLGSKIYQMYDIYSHLIEGNYSAIDVS